MFIIWPLSRESLLSYCSLSECEPGPLGMASGDIPDSGITASSYQHDHNTWARLPKYARLGGGSKFWMSGEAMSDPDPWIQVDLGGSYNVVGLQTEGNHYSDKYQFWVTQIKVQVGMISKDLRFIDDGQGQPKVCYFFFFLIKGTFCQW